MEWENKRVFITGADGFIGGWLTRKLIESKAIVTVLLHNRSSNAKLQSYGILDKVNIVYGSINDLPLMIRALNEYEIEIAFHLAGQTLVGVGNDSPLKTFETNIDGTWNILEAARLINLQALIITSTDKAYGDQPLLPITEDMPLAGKHPYAVSKSCADMIAQAYAKTYGLNVVITRGSNTYGVHDNSLSRIVPATIAAILNNEKIVIRSDGKMLRDYIYVDDMVSGYLAIAEAMLKKNLAGEAFNFGTNKPISVINLVKLIVKLADSKITPQIQNIAKNEIQEQYLDSSKAEKILGWTPKTSLEQGLKKTIAWYKKNAK